MTDCPDAEMRDQLPDVVHGSLDEGARPRVEAHLATCATCRAELALLQRVHGSLVRTVPLDVERIASALPRAAAARPWPMQVQWRRAAAIAIAAIGLSALVLGQSFRDRGTPNASSTVVVGEPTAPVGTNPLVAATPSTPVSGSSAHRSVDSGAPHRAVRGLSLAGGVTGLEAAELEILLSELDSFDGVTEAEPVELAPNVVLGDA